jgi:hypothetical protein
MKSSGGRSEGGCLSLAKHPLDRLDDPVPDTSIPAMITTPNTTYCQAVDRPMMSIIRFRPVRKNAAAKVENELAKPPVSEAPPMTTAAIGASRYWLPTPRPGCLDHPGEGDAGHGVEDRGDDVGRDLVDGHPHAHHLGCHRIGAHHLEPAAHVV